MITGWDVNQITSIKGILFNVKHLIIKKLNIFEIH
jgi:hypothetical protein